MARGAYPPKAFAKRSLVVHTESAGSIWRRIYLSRYADPLGFARSASRFNDPKTGAFGLIYLGSTVKVAFVEAILRDKGEGRMDRVPIPWAELTLYTCAEIRIAADLQLVDLRGDAGLKMGVPTDVGKAKSQTLARRWSKAFHNHSAAVDGIIYSSRLNEQCNIALYDRALWKVIPVSTPMLIECRDDLAAVINDLDLAII